MAKVGKVSPQVDEDDEEEISEALVTKVDTKIEQDLQTQFIEKVERRLDASDMALMESADAFSKLERLVEELAIRLDAEKEARLEASHELLCNMNQEDLSLNLWNACLNNYLAASANRFDILGSKEGKNQAVADMKILIEMHKNLVRGMAIALRVS